MTLPKKNCRQDLLIKNNMHVNYAFCELLEGKVLAEQKEPLLVKFITECLLCLGLC